MKKLFIITLCLCTIFAFTACGSSTSDESADSNNNEKAINYNDALQVLAGDVEESGEVIGDNDGQDIKSVIVPLESLSSAGTEMRMYIGAPTDDLIEIDVYEEYPENNASMYMDNDNTTLCFAKDSEFKHAFTYSYTAGGQVVGEVKSSGQVESEGFDEDAPVVIDDFEDPNGVSSSGFVGKDALEDQIGCEIGTALSYFASYLETYHPDLTIENFGFTGYKVDTDYVISK